jgi:uncharacterized membrane protein YbhN (UPF0104 family)
LALLALLAARLWHLWSSTDLSLRDVQPTAAVAAVVVSAVAVASYGCVWLLVLSRLGVVVHPTYVALFLKSQLGKYIPGSIWQFAGRVVLGRAEGIPTNLGLAAIVIEVAASLLAAVIAGSLVLSLGWAMPLYGVVWTIYGAAFWLTARALFIVPAGDVPLYIGVFALSWAVGFVAIFAPGGVGVREAVIAGLLAGHLGEAKAIVLAGASRIVLTAIDLALGAFAVGVTGRRASSSPRLEVRR